MSQPFVDWLQSQSGVGATVTSLDEASFEFEIDDQTIKVGTDVNEIGKMGAVIEDEKVFNKIYASLELGQTMRIGSGQWTFYSEPEVLRLIIVNN